MRRTAMTDRRILVVEDEPCVRNMIAEILDAEGYGCRPPATAKRPSVCWLSTSTISS
jgi:CheY-like chemotaxis protein